MQISESVFTVRQSGNLLIPAAVLQEMGLRPGNHVRIAYLTEDGSKNTFQEFLLSKNPLERLSEEQQIQVPNHILETANIPKDADLQIVCLDGLILICQDPTLSIDELTAILEQLQVIGELPLSPQETPAQIKEQLDELFDYYQKGVDPNDE